MDRCAAMIPDARLPSPLLQEAPRPSLLLWVLSGRGAVATPWSSFLKCLSSGDLSSCGSGAGCHRSRAELATSVRYPSRLHDGFVASHVINHAHKSVPTKDASYPVSPNALSKALDVPMNCIMAILHGQRGVTEVGLILSAARSPKPGPCMSDT